MTLRGSRDIIGIKQSGCMKFKFTDLYKDIELLNFVYNNAKGAIAENKSFELLLDIFEYRSRLHFQNFSKLLT
ncbi:MAG: hypothetical protein ACR5K2_00405 [Wolbachia sp.]